MALWIADKTLGETVKQAWLDSAAHSKLKEFFATRVSRKAERLPDEIMEAGHRRARDYRPMPGYYSGPRYRFRQEVVPRLSAYTDNRDPTKVIVEVEAAQTLPKQSEIGGER